ncbi:hypothetical protein [Microbulbifer sp. VAAF005]|uniref:hypothetical protein n=1 Tax=Microbulbifer sp. VAAF005 TaxID=3034230 RepID=UPI0024AD0583|nr:hypothetical protein [Microbulbifer sp. VAAF005]WHI47319.1 hypothetical protein P0078_02765 [Microbulbifer sp. VAAF005]
MNFQKLIFLFLFLSMAGCWDESKSPLIKNQSGQEITLRLVFSDHEEAFKINNNDSLLLPNLTENEAILSLQVVSENNDSVSLAGREIIDFMEKKYKVFIINEELFVYPENKSPDGSGENLE